MNRAKCPDTNVADYTTVVRRQLRDGDLLLCSGRGTFSKLIQRFTESAWSHVGFVLWSEKLQRVVVLESVEGKGVRSVPLSFYINNYNATGKPYRGQVFIGRDKRLDSGLTRGNMRRLGQWAVDRLGYPYDKREIVRIAHRITIGKRRSPHRDKTYICSEFVEACFGQMGLYFNHDERGFIAPADIAGASTVGLVARIV